MRVAILSFVLLACSVCMLAASVAALGPDDPPQYSEWSAPVNLGPIVNSTVEDGDPFITKDGLSLYFSSPRLPSCGGYDIWVSHRAATTDPWGPPENLGCTVNGPFTESGPVVTIDGHRLYFTSDRPGGFGGNDLYISRRHNKRDNFGWRAPENLGNTINTSANEAFGIPFEDDATGVISLYFVSNRPGGLFGDDIYVSTLQPDEVFGPAVLVEELSSYAEDRHPNIRRDGLEFYFMSNRPGSIPNLTGAPSFDIWVSTRTSTSDPWSEPVNVDPSGFIGINTNKHEGHPALSFDGTTLYFFAANRVGNVTPKFDIWVSTRTKLRHEHDRDGDDERERREHREHRRD
jgi:hypothetical protein